MPDLRYRTGTCSVAADAMIVTFSSALMLTHAMVGDHISINRLPSVEVTSVDGQLQLGIEPWNGATLTGVPYVLFQDSMLRATRGQLAVDSAKLNASLDASGYFYFVAADASAPDPSDGKEGQHALQVSTGIRWVRTGGVWVIEDGSLPLNNLTGVSYSAQSPTSAQKSQARANIGLQGRNRLINGGFGIDQRNLGAAVTVADNAYWADRWRYLGEASATLTARDTTMFGGEFNSKLTFTGTTDKGGIAQIVEGVNCKQLRSQSVVASIWLSVSNTRLGNIKMGIAQWTGTEDAPSADPIAAWGADGVTPTLAANWAWLNAPANLGVTTTPTKFSVPVTCGAGMNNLMFVAWNDDKTYNAGDSLYFSRAQKEFGTVASEFERRAYQNEEADCLRYFEIRRATAANFFLMGVALSTTLAFYDWSFCVLKRGTPSILVSSATGFSLRDANNGNHPSTSLSFNAGGADRVLLLGATASGLISAAPSNLHADAGGAAWIAAVAEI